MEKLSFWFIVGIWAVLFIWAFKLVASQSNIDGLKTFAEAL
jgi:hypothetical protein